MLRSRFPMLAGVITLTAFMACDGFTEPSVGLRTAETVGARLNYAGTEYPLHFYGDDTDAWEYLTPGTPVWVEIPADDQTPHSEDGYGKRRVCPNDQLIQKNAHLRMNYGLEELDLDFRGPFSFIRHVSTLPPAEGGSPYPTATYRFYQNAYTRDNRYYAPAGGEVLLACDGNYVANNVFIRLWVGYLYGKLYNGPIVRNPNFTACSEGGSTSGNTARRSDLYEDDYDPYEPAWGYQECEGGTDGASEGSGGTQYEPGDYTNGETVDWETGVGTGKPSACGADAKVEYICIEVWVDGVGWVEWSCGYATTC